MAANKVNIANTLQQMVSDSLDPRSMEASIALAADHLLAVELSGKHLGISK